MMVKLSQSFCNLLSTKEVLVCFIGSPLSLMQATQQPKVIAHLLIDREESCRGSLEDVFEVHLLFRQREWKVHYHVAEASHAFYVHINPRERVAI